MYIIYKYILTKTTILPVILAQFNTSQVLIRLILKLHIVILIIKIKRQDFRNLASPKKTPTTKLGSLS